MARTSLVAQTVRNVPAMQETQVRSLGREDPLEEGMATHPSILAWEIPWTEEPGRLQFMNPEAIFRGIRRGEVNVCWILLNLRETAG